MYREVEAEALKKYTNMSEDLFHRVHQKDGEEGGIRLITEKEKFRGREPRARSRSPRTPTTPRTPSPPRRRSPSPRPGQKRSRSPARRPPSPKRARSSRPPCDPHTRWQPTELVPHRGGLQEMFEPAYGARCMVVRYEGEEVGVIMAEGGEQEVVFHVNQVRIHCTFIYYTVTD